MTEEALQPPAAQPAPPIVLLPETIALIAQAVAAHLAAAAQAAPPVPEEPKPLPPLADPLWTGLVYLIKHGAAADSKWDTWLRAQLGADFDEYVRLYSPGGEHHNATTWDRAP